MENVFNIMVTSFLEKDEELSYIKDIGKSMYTSFLIELKVRVQFFVWYPLKTRELTTFKTALKILNIKLKDKVFKIKEERNLTTWLLVTSRCRPDIDTAELLNIHKFRCISVVPV